MVVKNQLDHRIEENGARVAGKESQKKDIKFMKTFAKTKGGFLITTRIYVGSVKKFPNNYEKENEMN